MQRGVYLNSLGMKDFMKCEDVEFIINIIL